MYLCGPGGYEIKLSPGSRTFPLCTAPSGHLILPKSEFDRIDNNPNAQPREKALQEKPSILHLPFAETHGPDAPLDESLASHNQE